MRAGGALLPAAGGLCLLFGLAACSGNDVVRAFGLKRSMPDEYSVTTRAPLSMPPSEKLVLPGAGSAHRPDDSPRMQALETLAPDIALHEFKDEPSEGQSALAAEAERSSRAPGNGELGDADAGFVDNLMFWHGGRAGSVVDGPAENTRLHKVSALGRKMNEGATPTLRGG